MPPLRLVRPSPRASQTGGAHEGQGEEGQEQATHEASAAAAPEADDTSALAVPAWIHGATRVVTLAQGKHCTLREVRSGGEVVYTECQLVEGIFQSTCPSAQ